MFKNIVTAYGGLGLYKESFNLKAVEVFFFLQSPVLAPVLIIIVANVPLKVNFVYHMVPFKPPNNRL